MVIAGIVAVVRRKEVVVEVMEVAVMPILVLVPTAALFVVLVAMVTIKAIIKSC